MERERPRIARGFMFVVGIETVAWARRYGIPILRESCEGCGAPVETTLPIAKGATRGLCPPVCECGVFTPLFSFGCAKPRRT